MLRRILRIAADSVEPSCPAGEGPRLPIAGFAIKRIDDFRFAQVNTRLVAMFCQEAKQSRSAQKGERLALEPGGNEKLNTVPLLSAPP